MGPCRARTIHPYNYVTLRYYLTKNAAQNALTARRALDDSLETVPLAERLRLELVHSLITLVNFTCVNIRSMQGPNLA